ncbi:MAG: hypothetical protein SFW09_06310 [Hyphomicrobiaceae bacterium]|nr:hypothetical protein [Hyphomicrobiaceae bacterium]
MDGVIYGAASAAADCFKALVPFFFFAAIRNRMWSQAAASAVVWLVVTAYSLTSALGHAALNRLDTTGQRAAQAQSYQDLRADLKRAEEQMGWIPQHRPAQTVQSEIDGLKTNRAWVWSNGCTDTKGKQSREFCQQLHGLTSELASAQQADVLGKRIADVKAKLANANANGGHGAPAMSEADPQAAVLSKLAAFVGVNVKVEDVQTTLAIFVALLLEVGSGFGMFVAFSSWRLHDRKAPSVPQMAPAVSPTVSVAPVAMRIAATPAAAVAIANDNRNVPVQKLVAPETDVERFKKERIDTTDGSSLTATALYEDYCAWCEEQDKEPLALPTFGREFGELGVQKAKIAGRVRYIGVSLKSGHALDEERRVPITAPPATQAA